MQLNQRPAVFRYLFDKVIVQSLASVINIKSYVCTLKCPNSIFFNIKLFLQFKFEIGAYTQLKAKFKKKSSRGVRHSTEFTNIGRIWRKGYRQN